jgi:hypothetical protein
MVSSSLQLCYKQKLSHLVFVIYIIIHVASVLLMRSVTFCYATDSILLPYFMNGDKMYVYKMIGIGETPFSVYSTELRIKMITFMKNWMCLISSLVPHECCV